MDIVHTIEYYISDCEIRGLTPPTILWYRQRLTLFASKLAEFASVTQLEEVTIAHLRQFVQVLMNTHANVNHPRKPTQDRMLSPFTVRGYVRALKVFFNWCHQEDLIGSNPSARLVQPKAPDYLIATFTVEHVEKMLAVCDQTTPGGFRDYVILLVFLDTGMRISELCGLCLADVHPGYVKVTGKGRKQREIGLHPNVARALWKYISKFRGVYKGVESVFLGKGGIPLHSAGIDSLLDRIKRSSGIAGVRVSAHTFRHTFAKFYLERGGELFDLSREMGHSTIQVTEVYLKDYKSTEARKRHPKFSPVDMVKLPAKKPRGRKGAAQE